METLGEVKKLTRSNRIANWGIVAVLIVALLVLNRTSMATNEALTQINRHVTKIDRDHEQLQLLSLAEVDLLKWAHSDHPNDKDSNEVLDKIREDLTKYLEKPKEEH